MNVSPLSGALHFLHVLPYPGNAGPAGNGQLLERFIDVQTAAAVLGVHVG